MMPSYQTSAIPPGWPEDVGITALELYFPSQFVDQSELEEYDKVSQGKYTVGLGQYRMGFCSDREDVYSVCLTVVQNLLDRTGVDPSAIGRLEVGTETLLDKSKSIKTVLMQLFEDSGNTEIEGIDTINACYGGTAALFNALAWIESSAWDGRYALVVAGDIAVYAAGSARCTGGAGAVAMLVGPNAPLVIERGLRGTHMQHVYDFYKPEMQSEYPTVDGKLSIQCYQLALRKCYERFKRKVEAQMEKDGIPGQFSIDCIDVFAFHSPYCKLVQKSIARLVLTDFLTASHQEQLTKYAGLEAFRDLKLDDVYFNRDVEKVFVEFSTAAFNSKTAPTLLVAREVGNMYTPSLYGCLASYLSSKSATELSGKRVALFSYGSGLAASMFSLRITTECSHGSPLDRLHFSLADIPSRLLSRKQVDASAFNAMMKLKEDTHNKAPYSPRGSIDNLFPGTWFLSGVDDMHRRAYERKPLNSFDQGGNRMQIKGDHKISSTTETLEELHKSVSKNYVETKRNV